MTNRPADGNTSTDESVVDAQELDSTGGADKEWPDEAKVVPDAFLKSPDEA